MHTLYQLQENVYGTACIASNADNPKKLWRSLSSILKRNRDPSLPLPSLIAQQLLQYFINKINGVRAATDAADPPSFTTYTGKQLTSFRELSVDEV